MPLYIIRSARGLDPGARSPYEVLAERGGGPEPWAFESLVECDPDAARELGGRADVVAVETAPPGRFEDGSGALLVYPDGAFSFGEDEEEVTVRPDEGDRVGPHTGMSREGGE